MDKFKELSNLDKLEINGGDFGPIDQLFEPWPVKALLAIGNAVEDVSDFFSGLGNGFKNGFKNTSKSWH